MWYDKVIGNHSDNWGEKGTSDFEGTGNECVSNIKDDTRTYQAPPKYCIGTAREFNDFVGNMGYEKFESYSGGAAIREKVEEDVAVFSASDEPCCLDIEPHQEMSYQPTFPSKFFLFCEQPSACGKGESGVTDMRKVTAEIKEQLPSVWAKLKSTGVTYSFVHSKDPRGYYCWTHQIASSKAEAVEVMRQKGYDFEFDAEENLRFSYTLPGVTHHPVTGEELYCNQLKDLHPSYFAFHPDWEVDRSTISEASTSTTGCSIPPPLSYEKFTHVRSGMVYEGESPFDACFGDGTRLTDGEIGEIRRIIWKHTAAFALKKGDVLILGIIFAVIIV